VKSTETTHVLFYLLTENISEFKTEVYIAVLWVFLLSVYFRKPTFHNVSSVSHSDSEVLLIFYISLYTYIFKVVV